MPNKWFHKIASDITAEEARIRPVSFEEAQDWCNFVVLQPQQIPPGLKLQVGTLRAEAPPSRPPGLDGNGRFPHGVSNRASYQFSIQDRDRILVVKEFLYDLGPPAWDHPSFWLNETEPFEVGQDIGWLGRDFQGRHAASVSIDRTMVELSGIRGSFTWEELKQVCRALRPASTSIRDQILATPIAELCYQRRYPDLIVSVPMGYWTHRRRPPSLATSVFTSDEVSTLNLKSTLSFAPGFEFRLDTVFLFGDLSDPCEIDCLFYSLSHPGGYFRQLSWRKDSGNRPDYPPILDRQPCSHRMIRARGTDIFHAYRDRRYGQHEAIWQKGQTISMIMIKPTPVTTCSWFERHVSEAVDFL